MATQHENTARGVSYVIFAASLIVVAGLAAIGGLILGDSESKQRAEVAEAQRAETQRKLDENLVLLKDAGDVLRETAANLVENQKTLAQRDRELTLVRAEVSKLKAELATDDKLQSTTSELAWNTASARKPRDPQQIPTGDESTSDNPTCTALNLSSRWLPTTSEGWRACSYQLQVSAAGKGEQSYYVYVRWLDADGFVISESADSGTLQAGESETVRGTHTLTDKEAALVSRVAVHIE